MQKVLGETAVFLRHVDAIEQEGGRLGPFDRGDLATGLPPAVVDRLRADGTLGVFDYPMLLEDLFP